MSWNMDLKKSCIHPAALRETLALSSEEVACLERIAEDYPMRVPEYYLSLIVPEDRDDPIRRMSVPESREFEEGGCWDVSGEQENTQLVGLQHKYAQTAMVLSTNQCAMYCRHCFRKRLVGLDEQETVRNLTPIVEYVRAHTEINNVLISGGDAFMNSNERLKEILEAFTSIEHIDFIRFGTRIPVVLPQRVTEDDALLPLLAHYNQRKQIYIVTQFNHPRELTNEAKAAIAALRGVGCVVRNQTVLLRGVNDQAELLAELLNGLSKLGVVPYYIFQCRPVCGVKNQFQLSLLHGSQIVETAKHLMSGQAKSVRYAMAHKSGKIEILGALPDGSMLFKYHQAKEAENTSRIFAKRLSETDGWLEDEEPAS